MRKKKNKDSEDEGFVYEQVIPQELRETLCAFASDCPYENLPKKKSKPKRIDISILENLQTICVMAEVAPQWKMV